MRYKDFVIQLGSSDKGRYVAQVLLSSQGRASWEFDNPFSRAELRSIDLAMKAPLRQRKMGLARRNFETDPETEGPRRSNARAA